MTHFTKLFRNGLSDCLDNPSSPDSHVLETISGRGTLFQIFMRDEAIRKLNALLSEIKFNNIGLNGISSICRDNIEIREKKKKDTEKVVTSRMRFTAVELLVANRYIDAEDSFYTKAENYLNNVTSFNEQISAWDIGTEKVRTEQWLLEHEKVYKTLLEEFKSLAEQQRDRLLKTF